MKYLPEIVYLSWSEVISLDLRLVYLFKVIFNGTYQLMDNVAWEMSLRSVDQSVLIDNIEDDFDWERLL
jgi:hypothetical protein